MARICLICPHHIAWQPRSLREADTLAEAGHEVRVVSRFVDPSRVEHDRRTVAGRSWSYAAVDVRRPRENRMRWVGQAAITKASAVLWEMGVSAEPVATRGAFRGGASLARLAAQERADVVLAHTQLALPAAAAVARRWGVPIGFDCEDLLALSGTDPPGLIARIERQYLEKCSYVSVASHAMGERLRADHPNLQPFVLYNAFPTRLRDRLEPPRMRIGSGRLRVHWFGQALGRGRGLEDAVLAIEQLGDLIELHLRGRVSSFYRQALETLAPQATAAGRLVFHDVVDHEDIIVAMETFDVGLSLEQPDHPNSALTASNKLFAYLLAGMAVVATDTPGQREVLGTIPAAGWWVPAGNVVELVRILHRLALERDTLIAARTAAWEAAEKRYCWDIERQVFLATVEQLITERRERVEPAKSSPDRSRA